MSRTYNDYSTEEALALSDRAFHNNTKALFELEYKHETLESLFKVALKELEKHKPMKAKN